MGIALGIVGGIAALIVFFVMKNKKALQIAEQEKGQALGDWTVYYDVEAQRIGLKASFGEEQLLRFLIFRLHDLFFYNTGMRGEQEALAAAVSAAAKGEGAPWSLAFPPAEGECFHSESAPDGKLFKYFDGTLFEGAVTQPRFLGGDSIAKAKGLVGECIAIAGYLAKKEPQAVRSAVEALVSRQMAQGDVQPGPKFWRPAVAAFKGVG